MKKLILGMMLALTACVFTSCQKGENFFNGTWTGSSTKSDTYWGGRYTSTYKVTLTLDKKTSSSTLVWSEYTKYDDGDTESDNGTDISNYRLVNDNMIIISESKNFDDITLSKQGDNLYWSDINMTLTKSK